METDNYPFVYCPCGVTFKATLVAERRHKHTIVHSRWVDSTPYQEATDLYVAAWANSEGRLRCYHQVTVK